VGESAGKGWAETIDFTTAPWPMRPSSLPPKKWGATCERSDSEGPMGFDADGRRRRGRCGWRSATGPRCCGLPAGEYTLRCRTIDAKDRRTMRARQKAAVDIEAVRFKVE